MAINLKSIPPLAAQPALPRWWLWLLFLVGGVLVGTGWTIFSNQGKTEVNATEFWETTLIFPVLFWLSLLTVRLLWFRGTQAVASGINEERERLLQHETQKGRRSLSVLGVSLRSALREPDDKEGQKQKNAIRDKVQALKTQASWQSDEGVRHSRLVRIDGETVEQLLSRELSHTLEALSHVLATLAAEVPLTVVVENSSHLSDNQLQAIWQQSWTASHIRQPVTYLEGGGLEVVDQWLDNPMNDPSLLLVVAVQLEPVQIEGSAEAVVGLLLKSRVAGLTSLATLHRPEQARGISNQDFHYALERAFDWVPIPAKKVFDGWLVGVNAKWSPAIATGLTALSCPINVGQNLHNLDCSLGYPGPAAPWLAIACATEQSACGKPQLIVSGDGHTDGPLWVTLVTPASEQQRNKEHKDVDRLA